MKARGGFNLAKKALIVDDSAPMRNLVGTTLTEAGFDVVQGSNGREGVDKAFVGEFDLVITDLNMPVMDGLDLIRKLRAMDQYKSTPILMLTTETDEKKKAEGRAAGATGWIPKPFDPDKLVRAISKIA